MFEELLVKSERMDDVIKREMSQREEAELREEYTKKELETALNLLDQQTYVTLTNINLSNGLLKETESQTSLVNSSEIGIQILTTESDDIMNKNIKEASNNYEEKIKNLNEILEKLKNEIKLKDAKLIKSQNENIELGIKFQVDKNDEITKLKQIHADKLLNYEKETNNLNCLTKDLKIEIDNLKLENEQIKKYYNDKEQNIIDDSEKAKMEYQTKINEFTEQLQSNIE